MAGNSETRNANGDITELTVSEPVATISYARKNNLGDYNNEELGIFLQVPLGDTLDGDNTQLEKLLDEKTAFVKAYVCKQLGLLYGADERTGVVAAVPAVTPKAAPAAKPASKPAVASSDEKTELWRALANSTGKNDKGSWVTDSGVFYDNRETRTNPKAPSYKHAKSGTGLWENNAPSWFSGPGQGESVG